MKTRLLVSLLVVSLVFPVFGIVSAQGEGSPLEFCGLSLEVPAGWKSWANCQEAGGMVTGGVDYDLMSLMPTIDPGFAADFNAAYSGFDESIVAAVINPEVGSDRVVTHMVAVWFPLDFALEYSNFAADDYRGFFEYMNLEPIVSGDIWFGVMEEFANGKVLETGMYLIPSLNAFVAVEGQVGFGNAADYDTLKSVIESLAVVGAETTEPVSAITFGGHPAGLDTEAAPMSSTSTVVTDFNTSDAPVFDEHVSGVTGDYQLVDFGKNCSGYVSAVANYSFEADTSTPGVAVTAVPNNSQDIGLLIQTPGGGFLCADRGLLLEGYPPEQLDLFPTIGNLDDVNGVYKVWITTPTPNAGFDAFVGMAVIG